MSNVGCTGISYKSWHLQVTYHSRPLHLRATRGDETQIAQLQKPCLCHLDPRRIRPPCPARRLFRQSNRPPPTSCLGRLRVQEGRIERLRSKNIDSNGLTRRRHGSRWTPLSLARRWRHHRLRSIAIRRCIGSRVDRACHLLV